MSKIWNDVKNGYEFSDGSKITQRHQTHMYDCYKLTYEHEGNIRTFIASKDHLILVKLDKLPKEAKDIVRSTCNGKIPLREDIHCEVIGYVDEDQKLKIYQYVTGLIDSSYFKEVKDLSNEYFECYLFYFKDGTYKEVFVKRIILEEESQKVDDNTYWIPLEGIHWLYTEFGEIEI